MVGFTLYPDPGEFPEDKLKGLSRRDARLARGLYQTSEEKAATREQERSLAESNLRAINEAIANARTPEIRKVLEAERANMEKPQFTLYPDPSAPSSAAKLSQRDVRAVEADMGLPPTLAESQAARGKLVAAYKEAGKQAQALEEILQSMPSEGRADIESALASVRAQQKRLAAEIERTGVGSIGRDVGAAVFGTLGAIGGGLAGSAVAPGPGTAIGGISGSVAGTGLGSFLGSKYDLYAASRHAVPVTLEEARDFVKNNVIEDIVWDGVANAVLFAGGKAIKLAIDPVHKSALKKIVRDAAANKRVADVVSAKDRALEEIFDTKSPKTGEHLGAAFEEATARAEAVPALIAKSGGYLPAKGQITGKPGFAEAVSRAVAPKGYEAAEEALQRAAREMQGEFLEPPGQMTRTSVGTTIADVADRTVDSVKARTGPVFERARTAGVAVDMEPVLNKLNRYISEYERGGSPLSSGEVGKLREWARLLESQRVGAGPAGGVFQTTSDAQGFISGRKQALRELIDGNEPSTYFRKILAEVTDSADDEYLRAIGKAPIDTQLKKDLLLARNEYREMNETMFSDDLRKALRKSPEDVGDYFYTKGTVTEIKNLDKALDLAIKEKVMTPDEATVLREGMTRDFIGRIAADPAKWTETLRTDKRLRDTLNALTSRPGMADLTRGMRMVEEAARIAERRNDPMAIGGTFGNLPTRSIIGLAFGFLGAAPGAILLSGTGMAKVLATAATRGDKGMVRAVQLLMQAYKAGDESLARPVVRSTVDNVIKYAKEHGIELLVASNDQTPGARSDQPTLEE